MGLEIQDGKIFQSIALGEISEKKQEAETKVYIRDIVKNKMYPGANEEVLKRFFNVHPEEREEFEKQIASMYGLEIAEESRSLVLDNEKARLVVEKSQPERRQGLADDLYNTVANNLDLDLDAVDENKDYIDLKYYTAVGSKLDYIWGVDCFMVYTYLDEETNEKKEITITIDITINTDKFDSKADLTLLFEKEDIAKKGAWKGSVNKNGKMIADKIKEKIANRQF